MIAGTGSPFQGSEVVNRFGSQGDALGSRRTPRWGWGCLAVDFRMGVLVLLFVLEPMGSRDGPERGACWVEYEYRPAG